MNLLLPPGRRPFRQAASALALALVYLFAAASQLHAANFTVDRLTDAKPSGGGQGQGNKGDLRYCLTQANFGGAGAVHTIGFGVKGKLLLGGQELVVNSDVTIASPSRANITISGKSTSRIFFIAQGHTVTLSGLTLTKGNGIGHDTTALDDGDFDGYGGAILNDGSVLTVNGCTISSNVAINDGGGIYNSARDRDATLTGTNSTIADNSNTGGDGGGIASSGFNGVPNLALTNCIITGNSAGYIGGGISSTSFLANLVTIDRCTISGNSAVAGAGGIRVTGIDTHEEVCVSRITESTISGNSSATGGGGIVNGGAEYSTVVMTLEKCTVSGNTAVNRGGGLYNLCSIGNNATLNVLNCTISGNSSQEAGGGIINVGFGTGTVNVNNSTIVANTAQTRGGGIYNVNDEGGGEKAIRVANSTIAGNSALTGGGGIANDGNTDYSAPTVALGNTLFALHRNGGNYAFAYGTATSGGYNLSDDKSCVSFFTGAGDQNDKPAGLKAASGKPSLEDNGGPTKTVALSAGSPALNAGKAAPNPAVGAAPTTDQRDFPRPINAAAVQGGDGSDIGAYESGSGPAITLTAAPVDQGTVSGGGTIPFGTQATVTASPGTGFLFVNWTEDDKVVSTSAAYKFKATQNRDLVAHFRPILPPTLVLKTAGGATLASGVGTQDFGLVPSGTTARLTFTVQNPGDSDLTLGALTVDGAAAADFTVTAAPRSPVASGRSTTVTVTFSPSALGQRNATLHLASNDAATPTFDLALTATGLPPLSAFKAAYQGFLISADGRTEGFVKLNPTASGKVTGSVTIYGVTRPLNGKFTAGIFTQSIKLTGNFRLILTFQLGTDAGAITGTASDGTTSFTANAGRNPYTTAAPLDPAVIPTGRYTVLIAPPAGSSVPPGTGYAKMTVSPTGAVSLAGKLGDGTPFSASAIVLANKTFSFFVPLYSTANPGSIYGTILFDPSQTASDATGVLHWSKPRQSGAYYPEGFSGDVNLRAAHYVEPKPGQVLNFTNKTSGVALVTLSAGTFPTVSDTIAVSSKNKVTQTAGNDSLTMRIDSATGYFSGRFAIPGTSPKKFANYSGVVSQKENLGAGVFQEAHTTGTLTLTPQ